MNVNLRELRAFIAVADHGSFTKASTQLRVTQPTSSRYIQQLERALHARLFIRQPRGARLTAHGEFLLTKARAVVTAADDLTRAALTKLSRRGG